MFRRKKKSHGADIGTYIDWRPLETYLAKRGRATTQSQSPEEAAAETRVLISTIINATNKYVDQIKKESADKEREASERHKAKLEDAERKYKTQIDGAKREFKLGLDDIRRKYNADRTEEKDRQKSKLDGEVERVTGVKDCEIKEVERKYGNIIAEKNWTITELRGQLRGEKALCGRRIERLTEEHEEEVKVRNDVHDEELKDVKEEHTVELELQYQREQRSYDEKERLLKLEYEKREARLMQQIQQLGEALVARDDKVYEGDLFLSSNNQKTDERLEEDFMSIWKLVDGLSALPWKTERQVWSVETLRKAGASHRQRAVERAILKDAIWTTLGRHIFASPFRVYGEEGRALENEWVKNTGEDAAADDDTYNWPTATVDSERWRYMTIKLCQEALKSSKTSSQFDPRTRLIRKGFSVTMSTLVEELKTELSLVVDVEDQVSECLAWLAKRAAAVWLDFARHRCRLVVRMPGQNTMSLTAKSSRAEQGESVRLTVRPELGRFGNAEGVGLEAFTTIGACDGVSIVISGGEDRL